MRRFVGIFSVSVIAIMAACNVFAATSDDVADSNIASVGYVKGAIEDLDVTDTAVTGQVVTKVSQTDGKIAVSRGTVSYNNLTDKPALKTVATTGSYNDLTNKPTIPAAQVQPDWNATTGMGAIKNKLVFNSPELPGPMRCSNSFGIILLPERDEMRDAFKENHLTSIGKMVFFCSETNPQVHHYSVPGGSG